MSANGGPRLRAVVVNLISNPRRLAILRIDQLHIRNINPRFFLDDAAAPVTRLVGALVPLDDSGAFDFYLVPHRRDLQDTTTLATVATSHDYHLVVFLNSCAFGSAHVLKSPPAP